MNGKQQHTSDVRRVGMAVIASEAARAAARTDPAEATIPIGGNGGAPDDLGWKERIRERFRHRFMRTLLRVELSVAAAAMFMAGYAWFSFSWLPDQIAFHPMIYFGQFAIVSGTVMAGVLLVSLRISEKICNHLSDATDRIHQLIDGEVPRRLLCFQDDEFHELSDMVNELIARADRKNYREMFHDN